MISFIIGLKTWEPQFPYHSEEASYLPKPIVLQIRFEADKRDGR